MIIDDLAPLQITLLEVGVEFLDKLFPLYYLL